jgi:hypothetical protein
MGFKKALVGLMASFVMGQQGVSTAPKTIKCPKLECSDDGPLEGNVCFEHDGDHPSKVLKGGLCFDIKTAPITALPYFCPFVLNEEKQYAWVEEYL